MKKQIEKVLVIAPHPDDEINLAAQLIIELHKLKAEVYVLYTTNGDADFKIGNRRLGEAIRALSLIDIPEKNIIFLGYANDWKEGTHIFESNELVTSKLGKTKTNALKTHPEYCYRKYGKHHDFIYSNFKQDFKDVINELLPDLLICVDFDKHPDHRAASLTFEKVMGELLKERAEYRPLVLKKFAYNGVWFGKKDYYNVPFEPTLKEDDFFYSGALHELESPAYIWDERLAFKVDSRTTTMLLKDNLLYKMAKKHKSTIAWYQMQRVINADMVYWYRPTMNYAIDAKVIVSSGDSSYLNDFVLFGYSSILNEREPFINASNLWQPDVNDSNKSIEIVFKEPRQIRYIKIYEDCNVQNHIKRMNISINKSDFEEYECSNNGTALTLDFEKNTAIKEIQIVIKEYEGIAGISEIELLPQEAYGNIFPFENYCSKAYMCSSKRWMTNIERIILNIWFLFTFKAGYEVRKWKSKICKVSRDSNSVTILENKFPKGDR